MVATKNIFSKYSQEESNDLWQLVSWRLVLLFKSDQII